jgi:replicative DNA helicase
MGEVARPVLVGGRSLTQLVPVTAASQSLVEAEYVLLASLMYDNGRIDAVADILNPEDFAEPAFGHVYGLVVSEYAQGRPANIITIRPMIADMPAFSGVEGQRFWRDMATSSTLLMRPTDGAKMIAREARKRRLAEGLRDGIIQSADPQSSVESIADIADAAIVGALSATSASTSLGIGDAFNRLAASFDNPARTIRCNRVETIDNLTGGFRRKQLIILAGRPGMGKTAVALSMALGTALDNRGTLFVSLEMGADELSARMMSDLSFDDRQPISMDELLAEQVPQRIIDRTIQYGAKLAQFPLRIEDVGHMTIGRLAMTVRRQKRRMAALGVDLELVVIDYLQLLSADQSHRSNYEAISEISRALRRSPRKTMLPSSPWRSLAARLRSGRTSGLSSPTFAIADRSSRMQTSSCSCSATNITCASQSHPQMIQTARNGSKPFPSARTR